MPPPSKQAKRAGTATPEAQPAPDAATIASWADAGSNDHCLPAFLTHLDVTNKFPQDGHSVGLLELKGVTLSGTGSKLCAAGQPLHARTEMNLEQIYSHRNFKGNAAMASLGLSLLRNNTGGSKAPKNAATMKQELPSLFEVHRNGYEARQSVRQQVAADAAAAIPVAEGFDPGHLVVQAVAARRYPYPLSHANAKACWQEAVHDGHAPGLVPLNDAAVPSQDLVLVTAMLCTLSVVRPQPEAEWMETHTRLEQLSPLEVDGDDLIGLLRNVYAKAPEGTEPKSRIPAKNTDAPEPTMKLEHQMLFILLVCISQEDWPGEFFNTLTRPELEDRKTTDDATPKQRAVREWMSVKSDGDLAEQLAEEAASIYEKRPDIFQKPLGIKEDENVKCFFDKACLSITASSETQLSLLLQFLSGEIATTDKEFRASGHVEDLPFEVAVNKNLAQKTLALVIFTIYCLNEHDNGKEGQMFKNLDKLGREGAGGSGNDAIGIGSGNRRGGIDLEQMKTLMEGQTDKLVGMMPDKTLLEKWIQNETASAGDPDVKFYSNMLTAVLAGRLPEQLSLTERNQYDEISKALVEAAKAAMAARRKAANPAQAADA